MFYILFGDLLPQVHPHDTLDSNPNDGILNVL